MLKADQAHSTTASGLNRAPSPEFLQLQKLAGEMREATHARGEVIDHDDPSSAAAGDALIAELDQRIDGVVRRIMAKKPGLESLVDRAAVFLYCCSMIPTACCSRREASVYKARRTGDGRGTPCVRRLCVRSSGRRKCVIPTGARC